MARVFKSLMILTIVFIASETKDHYRCRVCKRLLNTNKSGVRNFRKVLDDISACFGPETTDEINKLDGVSDNLLCETCRRAFLDFKKTGKTYFRVSRKQ